MRMITVIKNIELSYQLTTELLYLSAVGVEGVYYVQSVITGYGQLLLQS